jgi:alpha-tubulin suppressor-like RCC1 family protein
MPGSRWLSVDIASLDGFACGVRDDGDVYCWGDGPSGELGQGADLARHTTPVRVPIP